MVNFREGWCGFCSILEAIRKLSDSVGRYLIGFEFLRVNFHVSQTSAIF